MTNLVYGKLVAARAAFHQKKLKKSGRNTFSNYDYFELGDFLVPGLQCFEEQGLCNIVSFTDDVATMRIVAIEDGSEVVITSPMGSANLKGCHEVQNIGAVETYQRRYLWCAALEIVEHDGLEAMSGNDSTAPERPKKDAGKKLDGKYTSMSALEKAIKEFVASMGTVANHAEWYALKNESADLLAQAQRDKADWWNGWKGQPDRFVPLKDQIAKLEAYLDKEAGAGEFDGVNERDLK